MFLCVSHAIMGAEVDAKIVSGGNSLCLECFTIAEKIRGSLTKY